MNETVDATGYLILRGVRSRYGDKSVHTAKFGRTVQSAPGRLERDDVAVKITVRLPSAAFDPLRPEALVIVPEELVQRPVVVEAVDGAVDDDPDA